MLWTSQDAGISRDFINLGTTWRSDTIGARDIMPSRICRGDSQEEHPGAAPQSQTRTSWWRRMMSSTWRTTSPLQRTEMQPDIYNHDMKDKHPSWTFWTQIFQSLMGPTTELTLEWLLTQDNFHNKLSRWCRMTFQFRVRNRGKLNSLLQGHGVEVRRTGVQAAFQLGTGECPGWHSEGDDYPGDPQQTTMGSRDDFRTLRRIGTHQECHAEQLWLFPCTMGPWTNSRRCHKPHGTIL